MGYAAVKLSKEIMNEAGKYALTHARTILCRLSIGRVSVR